MEEFSNGELLKNKIYIAWKEADKEDRYEFLSNFLSLYNFKICTFLQMINKCKKSDKSSFKDSCINSFYRD